MQDRLAELRRQRALVADHLAWLDRELAVTSASEPAPIPPSPSAPAPSASVAIHEHATGPTPGAPQFVLVGGRRVAVASPLAKPLPEHDPAHIHEDVRRGCFLYFALASLLVVLLGALLIWASQAYKTKSISAPRVEALESR